VSPVKYELGFYIPEDDILHSHCRERLKSYRAVSGCFVRRSALVTRTIASVTTCDCNIWILLVFLDQGLVIYKHEAGNNFDCSDVCIATRIFFRCYQY
jgi:hypothetical protein